jgi:Protein of unknown function, DUF488
MAAPFHKVAIERAYEPRTRGDGVRILVDRLWPRGLRKDAADFDQWRKDLSPSMGSASSTVIVLSASPSSRSATAPSCERRKRLPPSQR